MFSEQFSKCFKMGVLNIFLFIILLYFYECTSFEYKKSYYANGKIKTIEAYKNGKLDGVSKSYYPNGNIEIIQNYHNNLRSGELKKYYEDGKICIVENFINDSLSGESYEYYENGYVKSMNRFSHGKLDGESDEFFSDEKHKSILFFKKDSLDGIQKGYFPNGVLKFNKQYNNGIYVFGKEYDSIGKIINIYRNIIVKSKDTLNNNGKFHASIELLGSLNNLDKVSHVLIYLFGKNQSLKPQIIQNDSIKIDYESKKLLPGEYQFRAEFDMIEDSIYVEHVCIKNFVVLSDAINKAYPVYSNYCGVDYGIITSWWNIKAHSKISGGREINIL